MSYVATAYPIVGNSVHARVRAVFRGRAQPTAAQATADAMAYDSLGLAQLPTNNTGEGVAWFVETVDGTEGQEDPVSRSVDGRAIQLTS